MDSDEDASNVVVARRAKVPNAEEMLKARTSDSALVEALNFRCSCAVNKCNNMISKEMLLVVRKNVYSNMGRKERNAFLAEELHGAKELYASSKDKTKLKVKFHQFKVDATAICFDTWRVVYAWPISTLYA